MKISVQCDRCFKMIEGNIDYIPEYNITTTSGYYIVSDGIWKQFGRWEEENICDDCMHTDKKYQKVLNENMQTC